MKFVDLCLYHNLTLNFVSLTYIVTLELTEWRMIQGKFDAFL